MAAVIDDARAALHAAKLALVDQLHVERLPDFREIDQPASVAVATLAGAMVIAATVSAAIREAAKLIDARLELMTRQADERAQTIIDAQYELEGKPRPARDPDWQARVWTEIDGDDPAGGKR